MNKFIKIKELESGERELFNSLGLDFSNLEDCYLIPGLADAHVHLREPGFCYKETIATGTKAAAAGGFTDIVTMPNLNPTPDSRENLKAQTDIIERDAVINVVPTGTITVGEKGLSISDMKALNPGVCGFTDDGLGVESDDLMQAAMAYAKVLDSIIIAHCEDKAYAKDSNEAEYKQLARDIELIRKTGCKYHMCHASTKESVELIRQAKAEGLDITCETAPHYLTITRDEIEDHGRFKMNPPIKSKADQDALIEGLIDGTIDMIATDHAPHSAEEKSKGFKDSLFGIVGLETAFPVVYTKLVKTGILSAERLIELFVINPRKRFHMERESLMDAFSIWNLDEEYTVNPDDFETMGRATPFEGWKLYGKCLATVIDGKVVWKSE